MIDTFKSNLIDTLSLNNEFEWGDNMNINGMGTSSMYSAMQSMQKSSASEMAEDVLSTLDSSGKGYIEQADLASAMSSFSNSDDMMSSEEMFSLLDSDGDGKVTQQELTSSFEDMAAEMRVRSQGGTPPPAPDGSSDDSGFTQKELTELAASEDSPMASLFSQLAESFDAADTNEDGTVSQQEAMAFQQSPELSSTENLDNAQLMRVMSELMKTYANTGSTTNLFSASV